MVYLVLIFFTFGYTIFIFLWVIKLMNIKKDMKSFIYYLVSAILWFLCGSIFMYDGYRIGWKRNEKNLNENNVLLIDTLV